jgi:hypothetical protein
MFVIPVHFRRDHKEMVAHAERLIENGKGGIAINPFFTKLIPALRTEVEKGDGSLDKEVTVA